MRWLVTGAHGMLGQDLVTLLRERGHEVTALGRADLDVTDPVATADAAAGFDVVANAAAYTAVDAAETDEDRAAVVNGTGPGVLAAVCADKGARLVHVSTDYVFAGDATEPYRVDAPTGPRTAYGRTKLAGERKVLEALPTAHVVRTAWVYTGDGNDFVATMRRLEGERDTLRVVDDQRGCPTYARDLADGLLELASRADGIPGGILHATNAGEATWFDLARAVFEEIGADPERVHPCSSDEFVRPAPRPAYSVLDDSAWVGAGLTPLRPWREALHEAIAGDGTVPPAR